MNKFNPISLEGTVVGLLFTKTGREISEAIDIKINSLDEEVSELRESIEDVDKFLEGKENELKELNDLYSNRRDEKEAQARPFRRQIDKVHKAWGDKEFEFNRETERLVGEKAVTFEKGFKDFYGHFTEIDEIADQVTEFTSDSVMFAHPAGATMDCMSLDGGMQKNSGAVRRVGNINEKVFLPTEQDKAAAKLSTLRNKVVTYRDKIILIQGRIDTLEREANELRLIRRHLKDEREYTLDLDRLSALGFEV